MTIAALLIVSVLAGCDDPSTARSALQDAGMHDIVAGGWDFWGCGKDDVFATKFSAVNPGGRSVHGVVCSGWFKGATVRFF
jgi:hypothetical protein